jgi:Flp pilus assembly protein CpaB
MNNLPLTTTDWSQRFNRQKTKYLLIALLLAFFVTLTAYKMLHRAQLESELINVVIATQNIPQHTQLKPEITAFRKIRKDQIPENAISDPKDVANLTSLINISKGQIIVSQFFKELSNPDSLSTELNENMIAISVGFDWLAAPVLDLKVGDIIDVIASESHKTEIEGKTILTSEAKFPVRNAKVIRVVKEGDYAQNGHFVIEITEEQAKNLMATKALKVLFNIIIK